MTDLTKFIVEGTLVVAIGSDAKSFAGNAGKALYVDVGLTCIVLNASEASLPVLLQSTCPTMATIIYVDRETPEATLEHLFMLADVIVRTLGGNAARIIRNRIRPTVRLVEVS